MPANPNPLATRGHEQRTIQFQGHHRRPSNRRSAFNDLAVLNPLKMIGPVVLARMKQADSFSRDFVDRRRPISFSVVASSATQPEILTLSPPTERFRKDVIHLESRARYGLRTQTISAAASGILGHQFAERFGNMRSTHLVSNREMSWPRVLSNAAARARINKPRSYCSVNRRASSRSSFVSPFR